jgi:hypothetical protein
LVTSFLFSKAVAFRAFNKIVLVSFCNKLIFRGCEVNIAMIMPKIILGVGCKNSLPDLFFFNGAYYKAAYIPSNIVNSA